jgi:hypothetical protein
MNELSEKLRQEIHEYLELMVRTGFADLGSLPDDAGEYLSDDGDPSSIESYARADLQDVLVDYRAEQRGWPSVTDCDRLDDAFAELEATGVVSRQNFWCCGTCGLAAIGEQMEASASQGIDARGYAFYHEQDTESAVEGRGIYLYYGSVYGADERSLEIAREIQEVLHRHGLRTEWNGSLQKRIKVQMDWKRRQTGGHSETE